MVAETLIIAAAFPQASDAQAAVQDPQRHGFSEHEISMVYTNAGHNVRAGLLDGAVWGGVFGAAPSAWRGSPFSDGGSQLTVQPN